MYRWYLPHLQDPITALRITRHWGCSITAPRVTYVRWRTSRPCISRIQVPCVMFWSLITATFTVRLSGFHEPKIESPVPFPQVSFLVSYMLPDERRALLLSLLGFLGSKGFWREHGLPQLDSWGAGCASCMDPSVRLVPRVFVVPLRCTTWASGYLGSCISTPWIILILLFTITGPWIILSDLILFPRFIRYAFLLWSPLENQFHARI